MMDRDELRGRVKARSCTDTTCGAEDCYTCYGEAAVDTAMAAAVEDEADRWYQKLKRSRSINARLQEQVTALRAELAEERGAVRELRAENAVLSAENLDLKAGLVE